MKLVNDAEPVVRIGMGEEREFRIKATAKAFRILSSGLYKDKIGAIVRELSANAFDAHKANGTSDRPFEVHIPNAIEPFFSIRDYGPGLKPDQMDEIYTTYFESTKSDSNDYVGALGLGCKSPFSYVTSFTVISRTDGIRRSYDAFISDAGIPAIALRHEQSMAADEEGGLEVIVPVTNRQDCAEFNQRAQSAYLHYPIQPKIVGATIMPKTLKTVIEGKGWRIVSSSDQYERVTARAIMGVVAYPLDINAISEAESNILISAAQQTLTRLLNAPIEIKFEIGELDVTAGREELSYDKQTLAAIRKRLAEIQNDLSQQLSAKFEQCANMREAKILFGELLERNSTLSQVFYHGQYRPKVYYKGEEITSSTYKFDLQKEFPNTSFHFFHQYMRGYGGYGTKYETVRKDDSHTRYYPGREQLVELGTPEVIYIKDLDGNWSARMIEYLKNVPATATRKRGSEAEPIVVGCEDEAELTKLMGLLEGVTWKKISELPKPEPKERKATTAKVLQPDQAISKQNPLRGTYDEKFWKRAVIDLEGGRGIYIPTYHNQLTLSASLTGDPETTERVSKLLAAAVEANLIDLTKETIHAIPASLQTKNLSKKWQTLDAVLKKRAEADLTKRPEVLATLQRAKSRSNFKYFQSHSYRFEEAMAVLINYLPEGHIVREMWAEYGEQKKVQLKFDGYQSLLYSLNISYDMSDNPYDLTRMWRNIIKAYPMMEYVFVTDGHRAVDKPYMIAQYIQQVDILLACSSTQEETNAL